MLFFPPPLLGSFLQGPIFVLELERHQPGSVSVAGRVRGISLGISSHPPLRSGPAEQSMGASPRSEHAASRCARVCYTQRPPGLLALSFSTLRISAVCCFDTAVGEGLMPGSSRLHLS